MPVFRVRWEIDIDAVSPVAAAAEALKIMRDLDSIATLFEMKDQDGRWVQVDVYPNRKTASVMDTLTGELKHVNLPTEVT